MYAFGSISELNKYIADFLKNDDVLSSFSVTGEISGFKQYPSGHCYFSVKDKTSSVNCMMWSSYAMCLDFAPKDGQNVQMTCSCGYYEANGKLQLYVKHMSLLGKGDLHEEYKKMFNKLLNEGLFSDECKKPIPLLPKRIGVISSPKGAVIHDIITTLRKRNPYFDLVLYPSAVQGEFAPSEITSGIKYFNSVTGKSRVDVLIIARGGGSFEDLYCFNDEGLARAVFASDIPVISAVGHEVDYTICDYVADMRAATPTAAAEICLPRFDDVNLRIDSTINSLRNSMAGFISARKSNLTYLCNHKALEGPKFAINLEKGKVDRLISQLRNSCDKGMAERDAKLNLLINQTESLSPLKVLSRGYAIAFDGDGNSILSVGNVKSGDKIKVKVSDGQIYADVLSTSAEE